jgi:beta-glucosidase
MKFLGIPALLFLPLFVLTIISSAQTAKPLPQLGKNPVKEVIAAMTPEEKVGLVIGMGMNFPGLPANMQGPAVGQTQNKVAGAAGTTFAIPRLNIPSIVVADGPAGLRIQPFRDKDSSVSYYCTAFPIATLLASSWDVDLVKRVGMAMGNEVKEYGVDILLGPALNNHRNPLGGRNFEYFSEDPLIAGKITAAYVNGVQSNGVGTSIKHFALNNHEWNRNTINVIAGERAIREIYLRSFQVALKESKPWTVMSSYNKINGTYASENKDLLTTILKNEWSFKGFVMTDWFGGSDAVAQMNAGNDLLMPGTGRQQKALLEALNNKTLDEKTLDRNVERILQVILLSPSFKKYRFSNKPDLKAHAQVARAAATEGMILLKNDGNALPITINIKKIAVFGNASYDMVTGGTGSGDVNEAYTISLIEGLQNAGYSLNDELKKTYTAFINEMKAKRPKPAVSFFLPPPIAEMSVTDEQIGQLADANDFALITIGRNSGEFADRKLEGDFYLNDTEKELIKNVSTAFHAKNKKAIVILNTGGVVEVNSWKNYPDAILLAWQPGQEAGNAVADVLSGKVNPSGKLATTFPADYKDVSSSTNFPGKVLMPKDPNERSPMAGDKAAEVVYEEGIYTGYRHYDKANINPAYEFGYGLSYTNFSYSNLKLSTANFNNRITATVDITNTGKLPGKEVAELYISAPGKSMDKPVQELKAFGKTALLQPGKKQTLSFVIDASSLASFDTKRSVWVAEPGLYTVKIGASSRNIKATSEFTVSKEIVTEKVNRALVPQTEIKELKAF